MTWQEWAGRPFDSQFCERAATLTALFGAPHFPTPHLKAHATPTSVPRDRAPGLLILGGGRAPAQGQQDNLDKPISKE